MASFPDLRSRSRSANAESKALRWFRSPKLLAVSVALLLTAFIAVSELAALRGTKAHDSSAYLTRELGPPLGSASLVRVPQHGVRVDLGHNGFSVTHAGAGSIRLSSRGTGQAPWRHYTNGVTRPTPFGAETVITGPGQAEQLLTVARRHGTRTWEWNLGTSLKPAALSNGFIELRRRGSSSPVFQVLPVSVLDRSGKNVTPAGAHWKLKKRDGSWRLQLKLDDTGLPVPYLIDPAIVFDVASSAGNNASNTITWNHTVANQPNRMLLVSYNSENTGTASCQPTSVTYNGVAMTLAGQTVANNPSPNWDCVGIYYLANPANGTHAVTINFTGVTPTNDSISAVAMSIYSVSQNAPDAVATSQAAGLTSTNITTVWPNSWVIDGIGLGDLSGNLAASAGQTSRAIKDSTGSNSMAMSTKPVAAVGSTTMSWTRSPAPNRSGQVVLALSQLDNTAPSAPTITPSESNAFTYVTGTTVYYNPQGTNSGTFTVDATSTDADSGIKKINFPALTGITGGGDDLTSPYQGSYSWTATSTASGSQTVTVTNGQNLTSTGTFTMTPDTTNPTGSLTAPASSSNVRGNAVAVSSNSADTGSGVASAQFQYSPAGAGTWTNIGAADTTSPYSVNWDTTAVGDGLYDLRVVTTDNVSNTFTSPLVTNVRVDNTLPANVPTLQSVSPAGSAFLNGTTVYYRGTAAGNFQIQNAVSDSGSGPASSIFPALGGTVGTWTHTAQTVNTPAGGPYVTTNNFAWSAGETNSPTESITSTDTVGNTSNATVLTFTNDSTVPSGSITAPAASANVSGSSVTVSSNSADGGAGVASAQFQRSPAGAGTWTNIGSADTTSPYSVAWDTTALADGLYDLRVITTDNVGNTFTSAAVTNVRVDNTKPTNTVTVQSASPAGSAFQSGTTVYYRGAAAGSFQLQNAVSDAGSGPASAIFPVLGGTVGTWTHTAQTVNTPAGGPYVTTNNFAWSAGETNAPTESITSTDNAGNTSNATVLTFTNDSTAPSGTITAPAASANVRGSSVTVSSNSADSGSGVASAQFQSSPAGAGTWTNIGAADTTSPYSVNWDTTALADGLYDLRVITTDNVGNTFTSASVTNVRVDNTNPTNTLSVSGASPAGSAFQSGTTVYYRGAAAGSFQLQNAVSDGGSGPASSIFPALGGTVGTWTHTAQTVNTPAGGPYVTTNNFAWSAGETNSPTESVTSTDSAGNTSAASVLTFTNDSTNPTGAITAPAASAIVAGSSVTVSSNSADGGSGVASAQFQRSPAGAGTWTNIGSADTTSPYSVTWDTTAVADGLYDLRVITTDNVGNTFTSAAVTNVRVDNTKPTNTLSLQSTSPAGSAYQNGTTIYYRGSAAGNFQLQNTVSDAGSGPASAIFPALGGTVGTWTHTAQTVNTPAGGPYTTTNNFAWTAGETNSPTESVTSTDTAGNTSTATVLTFTNDSTSPSVTAPSVTAGYYTSPSVPVAPNGGTDGGAGVDGTSSIIQRDETTLTNGTCGAFPGVWTTVALTGGNDTTVQSGKCYRFRELLSDNVGNQGVSGASNVAEVDTSAPSVPTLAFSNLSANAYWDGSATLYFRPSPGGTFTVTAASTDAQSGVASYGFGTLNSNGGSNWNGTQTGDHTDYTFDGTTTAPSTARTVNATNAAGSTSGDASYSIAADTTAPNVTAPTVAGGFYASLSVPVTKNGGTDGGAGVDGSTSVLERDDAPLSNGSCGAFSGTWTTVTLTAGNDTSVVSNRCYKYRERLSDHVGNQGTSGVSNVAKVDTTAPQTTIDSGPSDPSNDTTPTFAFSSNEAVSSFECRIDGGSWSTCTSPDTISPALAEGSHTFDVRAIDLAGNVDSSPASTTWSLDTTAPVTSLDSGPGSPSNDPTPDFSFSSNEPGSTFQCRIDGGSWSTCTSTYTVSPALGEGTHTFDVRAIDPAGNPDGSPASQTWTVDLTPPSTTIDSGPSDPSNDTTPTFSFSATEPGSTFECRIDGGSWSPCTSPDTTPALGAGSHTYDVRATDPAGNTDGTPASFSWTIDLTAPDTSIGSAPPALDNDATPTFTFSSTEAGSTFECRIDGGGWVSCASPYTTAPLAEGSHTFDVRATDQAGNVDASPASHTWSIDLGPPSVTITAPTTYINSSDPSVYTVTATTPDADVTHVDFYECSNTSANCGTGTWTQFDSDSSAPYSGSWTTPGADGTRAIRAVAVDAALNTGADVRTITIDRTSPSGVTISYPNGYTAGSFAITTSNGPDSDVDAATGTLERQTGNLANDACSSYSGWSPATSPDSVASGHCAVYRYRIADNAGNWSTATSGNVVKSDTAAPTSAQDDPGANLRQTVTLTTSAGDTGGSGMASVAFQRRPAGGGSWTTISTDTTSPYSASFDTTTVADGLYDFRTVATDVAGNTETSPVVVANRRIDNTAPSATMLSPGNPVRGTVTLASNTSDGGSGIATVTYELAPSGGSFNTQPASWDTTLGADGLYDLRVTATDTAGNSTTSPALTTRVDNTPPALTFSSPASGATVSGTVSLTASSSDASPASPPISFAYKLHSAPASAYAATGASWNTTTLPAGDGLYDLRATATDAANNTTTVVNTSVLVDNAPPAISITSPAPAINGSLPSPTSFAAAASDPGGSGVAQVQFFECSDQSTNCSTGVWSPLGTVAAPGPYSVSWNIPGVDGNYALAAVATDNAGHPSSAIRNVSVDRTAPDTTIVGKPADPSNAATPSFTFSSSEPGSTFECRVDGGSWTSCTSPYGVAGLTDNSHTFDVRATDAAGNTDPTPDTWTWHRDTTDPNATINNPGANVRQTILLTSAENDPPANGYASGLASVTFEYSANGTTWAAIGTNSSAPFTDMSWDTTAVADGVYHLRIVVHDVAGNVTTSTPVGGVRIDNTAPTTSQTDPGQYLRATKTLDGSAADSGSGVDHVDFQQAPAGSGSWTTIGTATTAPYSVAFDTTTVADGHYDFRTVAYDVAGNQTASAPISSRLVDNTPPAATLNDPGAYLRGAVNLTSSTSDPGGANASGVVGVAYEYSTNGGTTWQPTGSTFDSTSVADGNVQLHVVATDAAGNSATSAALTKLVDNTKPNTTDNAPSGWQSSPVTVTLSPTDAGSGVNVTEYSIDGNPTYTVGSSVVIPAPSDGSNDGAHTIAYFSVDNAGNIESVKSATVLIDATPPTCPSCTAANYLRGTVTLSASPSAGGSGIQSVAFEYADAGTTTWTTIGTDSTGPAPYTASWDTTAVPDGLYDIRIVITDNAGNATTTDLPSKVVDNTAPNVATVGAPTQGQLVSGTIGITASASDATSPIASVQFLVNGNTLGTDTTAPWTLNWNTASGPDGAATIQVVVTDMAGNSTTSPVRDVTVDNVSPTPTLADPGTNLSGIVSLSASSDPDTTQVDFERRPAGGGSWTTIASDTTLPWGTSLDTATLADGLYDFRAVATDGTGHTGTSAIRANVRIDNTAPSGSITAPAAGATVGGTNVTLSSSAADSGSGVASVSYELRPTGGGAFTQVASSSSAPFSATWDATTVATGSYDIRPVVTDRAGNTFTGAAVTFTVDVTAPTVTLTSPGSPISGTVTLNASVTGSGATSVVFGATPAGGATWTWVGTDTTAPWSTAFDTTKLADGVYDLRATVSDNLGNTSQDVVTGIRIDNTPPRLVSSTPAEGSTVSSANAISLVANEPVTPVGVTLDGSPTVAPVVSGTHVDYNTGALAVGAHTLAGELQDASGKKTPFRLHFTVYSSGTPPPVEKNTSQSSGTTVTSADGFASATMPAGAWSTTGNDWIVLRIAPVAAPSGLTNGFGPGPEALDVSAHWALSGVELHQFAQPIDITIHSTERGLVPATYDGTGWRVIHRVPTAGALPVGWDDGFYTDGNGFHVLTKHLSLFALLKDEQAPAAPQNVRGYLGAGGLTIRWLPGDDNSGTYDFVTLFSDSTDSGHFGPDYTAATVAGWQPGDPRIFRLQETDLAGNQSGLTPPLVQVPSLIGMTPDEAEAALAKLGLSLGSVTSGGVGDSGTITGPVGLVLAPQGASIDVTVAGSGGSNALAFKVVTAAKFKPARRKRLAARVTVTRSARITAQLFSPRHVRLFTWRLNVRAGATIVRLPMPRQVRRLGVYTMTWSARADQITVARTLKLRVVGKKVPRQRMQIVLAGLAAKNVGARIAKQSETMVDGVDPTFDAAANRNRDVRVLVVDVDELGLATVRDLHAVFPSMKIVALAAGPKTMAAALRAGAKVVLPRSTPPAKLAKIIKQLSKKR